MTATSIKFSVGSFPQTTVTYTPVMGLVAPVKAGTVVGTVSYDRTDSAKGAVMDIADLVQFSIGGTYPNYKIIAKVDLADGAFAVGVAPLPTGGELKFSIAKAPVVTPPPVDPPPVPGLPVGAVTAMTDVMKLDATNTGCRIANLTSVNGFDTTADGQVISGLRINGRLSIAHKNVVVRDCVITGDDSYAVFCDSRLPVGDGVDISYCEVMKSGNGVAGILKSVYRCNIHDCENGLNLSGGPQLLVNNYIHNLGLAADGHNDGVENNGVSGMHLLYNRIIADPTNDTSAVMLNNQFGPITTALVQGNDLEGGQYCLYADNSKTPANALNLTVEDNFFKNWHYGAMALYDSNVTQSGNTLG